MVVIAGMAGLIKRLITRFMSEIINKQGKRISQMPVANVLNPNDLIPIVQDGITKSIYANAFAVEDGHASNKNIHFDEIPEGKTIDDLKFGASVSADGIYREDRYVTAVEVRSDKSTIQTRYDLYSNITYTREHNHAADLWSPWVVISNNDSVINGVNDNDVNIESNRISLTGNDIEINANNSYSVNCKNNNIIVGENLVKVSGTDSILELEVENVLLSSKEVSINSEYDINIASKDGGMHIVSNSLTKNGNEIATENQIPEIVNGLTSTDNNKTLGASQGSVITGMIDNLSDVVSDVESSISSIMLGLIQRGTVPDLESLPTDAQDGWAFVVTNQKNESGNSYIFRYTIIKDDQGVIISSDWENTGLAAFPSDVLLASDLTNNITNDMDTAPSNFAVNGLKSTLYGGLVPGSAIAIPSNTGSLAGSIGGHFSYQYQNAIQGKHVTTIKVVCNNAGTFSVLVQKNRGDISTYSYTAHTYNMNAGMNVINFDKDLSIDETLGFTLPTDTTGFKIISGVNNPIAGSFYTRNNTTGAWTMSAAGNLCIEISIRDYVQGDGDIQAIQNSIALLKKNSKLVEKSFSILADSVSSYAGYVVPGNPAHYPKGDVDNIAKMWWAILRDENNMQLLVNNAYSGSTVTGTNAQSFGTRLTNLGETPDIIFINGGTNDFNAKVAIGEYNWGVAFDRTKFKQAVAYTIENLLVLNPNSDIVYLSPLQRKFSTDLQTFPIRKDAITFFNDYVDAIQETCELYGVRFIDLRKCGINFWNIADTTLDNVHPNALGMQLIASYIENNI